MELLLDLSDTARASLPTARSKITRLWTEGFSVRPLWKRFSRIFFSSTGIEFGWVRAYGVESNTGGVGGAVTIVESAIQFRFVTFSKNEGRTAPNPTSTRRDFGAIGGAVAVFGRGLGTCNVSFVDSLFSENHAEGVYGPYPGMFADGGNGGAFHTTDSYVEFTRVRFWRNYAEASSWFVGGADGGAVLIRGTIDPDHILVKFVDVTFEENMSYGSNPMTTIPWDQDSGLGGEGFFFSMRVFFGRALDQGLR